MKTQRQYDYNAVLEWIKTYKAAHDGNWPGYERIMAACGISSKSVVSHILDALEKERKLYRDMDDNWCVVRGEWSYVPPIAA